MEVAAMAVAEEITSKYLPVCKSPKMDLVGLSLPGYKSV